MRTVALPLLALAGCLPAESSNVLVNESPFGGPAVAPPPTRSSFTPGSLEATGRVDGIGRNLLAANPQVGVKPLFRTIGSPDAEVFHRGTAEINITEGLVRQCRTDGQLAAILALELAKMVSEREALAPLRRRTQERELPPDLRVPGDPGSDMTRLAELGKYHEPDRRRHLAPPPPPDPQALARTYLRQSSYDPTELDSVAPLLRAAAANTKFEKQLTAPGPARPWVP
jgi:hypothetical protein